MEKLVTLEEALELVLQLSLVDKVRLIKQVAPQIERELTTDQPLPRKSLRGLWRGSNISESDIAASLAANVAKFPE